MCFLGCLEGLEADFYDKKILTNMRTLELPFKNSWCSKKSVNILPMFKWRHFDEVGLKTIVIIDLSHSSIPMHTMGFNTEIDMDKLKTVPRMGVKNGKMVL